MKRSLFSLGFALALCPAAPSDAQTLTAWDQPVNVTAADGSLIKSGGCDLCSDSGAHSRAAIPGNGYAEFVTVAGHRVTAGLSTDVTASTGVATMEFAFSLWPNGSYEIRERGIYKSEGSYADGDRLRISIDNGVVTYRRNGLLLYTSAAAPAYPLVLDVTLSNLGASIREASVVSAASPAAPVSPVSPVPSAIPVAWESPIRVNASNGGLVKSAGCDGCQDSGANSIMRLTGEGHAEFVHNAGVVTAGLSSDVSAATTMMTMNYAFTVQPNGIWEVRELGAYRKDGSFAPGDRFRVAVEGTKVVYRRNGAAVYTSAVVPAGPLVFDVTLSTLGAALSDATMRTGPSEYAGTTIPPTPTTPSTPAPPPVEFPPGIVTSGTYTAMIDRQAFAEPALPALGAAGTTIADPVFQSRIGRITDALTRPGRPSGSFRTPSSPHQSAWSANGTYLYVTSGDGTILPFRFDPVTATARRIGGVPGGEGGLILRFYIEPQFSYVNDAQIYGSVGGVSGATRRTIDQFDFSTGAYTRLLDLDALVPGLSGTYIGGVASSAGSVERVMAFFGGASQDRHHRVVVFDKAHPARRVMLDTVSVLNMSLHHAAIDRSGRYVMLYSTWADQALPRKAAQSYVWDTETGAITELNAAALPYGHDAFGYGVSVNQDCCTSSTWDAAQWQFRGLSSPVVTRDVIKTPVSPKQIYLADHATWNNARPDQLMPFISGLFRAPASTTPWRAWDDEIVAVQTDTAAGAEAIVWRFAHHRSDVRSDIDPLGVSFWYQPRPNVSPDGRWALFTSNWEKTLGTDPTGDPTTRARQDVFVVELKK